MLKEVLKNMHYHDVHRNVSCKCPKCTRKRRMAGITAIVIATGLAVVIIFPNLIGSSNLQTIYSYLINPSVWLISSVVIGIAIFSKLFRKYQKRRTRTKELLEEIEDRKNMPLNEQTQWYCSICGGHFPDHTSYVQHHYGAHS